MWPQLPYLREISEVRNFLGVTTAAYFVEEGGGGGGGRGSISPSSYPLSLSVKYSVLEFVCLANTSSAISLLSWWSHPITIVVEHRPAQP